MIAWRRGLVDSGQIPELAEQSEDIPGAVSIERWHSPDLANL